jgi:hypothetical protein
MQDGVGPWAGEASSGTYFHLSVGCLIVLLAMAALQNRVELKLWLRRQRWARRSWKEEPIARERERTQRGSSRQDTSSTKNLLRT